LLFGANQLTGKTYAILNESPRPRTGLKRELPQELVRTVNKCLGKDPDKRY